MDFTDHLDRISSLKLLVTVNCEGKLIVERLMVNPDAMQNSLLVGSVLI